jgi:chemotaxis protein methyltransferase CheR
MRDASCVEFLKWALPQLGLAWTGFRRVHRQVCKRIGQRLRELHLPDSEGYRAFLERDPTEWDTLASFCRIPISRFFRDRTVFERLEQDVFPSLAAQALADRADALRCWSAGCAAGEEPYSLNILWRCGVSARFPSLSLDILASDVDEHQLERARIGLYRGSSLREVPEPWRETAFERSGQLHRIKDAFRAGIVFERRDLLRSVPAGPFDIILCRNTAFTYFSDDRRREFLARACSNLRAGGALIIGIRERLPADVDEPAGWYPELGIFRRSAGQSTPAASPAGDVDPHQ